MWDTAISAGWLFLGKCFRETLHLEFEVKMAPGVQTEHFLEYLFVTFLVYKKKKKMPIPPDYKVSQPKPMAHSYLYLQHGNMPDRWLVLNYCVGSE